MAGKKKLIEQAMQLGFNGGWAAACISLAMEAEKKGDHTAGAWLRARAQTPDRVQIIDLGDAATKA